MVPSVWLLFFPLNAKLLSLSTESSINNIKCFIPPVFHRYSCRLSHFFSLKLKRSTNGGTTKWDFAVIVFSLLFVLSTYARCRNDLMKRLRQGVETTKWNYILLFVPFAPCTRHQTEQTLCPYAASIRNRCFITKQSRESTEGYSRWKSSKDMASSKNMVSTIGTQASLKMGTGQGMWKGKPSLLACHTSCKYSMEISLYSVKVKFGTVIDSV